MRTLIAVLIFVAIGRYRHRHLERSARLPCLGDGFLGFELREGVSDNDFRRLLVLFGECIARITYTGPAQPGWRPGF